MYAFSLPLSLSLSLSINLFELVSIVLYLTSILSESLNKATHEYLIVSCCIVHPSENKPETEIERSSCVKRTC